MAEPQAESLIPGLTNPALRTQAGSDTLADTIQKCSLCGRIIDGRSALVKSKIACVTCAARDRDIARRSATAPSVATSMSSPNLSAEATAEESAAFPRALLFGTGAAVLGLVLYAAFTIITHLYLGYVALAVGWLVGKAMMQGSGGVGGPRYQMVAVVLTYAAISLASIPIHLSHVLNQGLAIDWPSVAGPLLLGAIASPFLELQRGSFGIIGLVILFVGLRVAFRLTKERTPKASAL
jgi:hypothetical protein